jgi:hypothetical protein
MINKKRCGKRGKKIICDKKSQITIFVIIAIILVASVIFVFTLRGKILPQIFPSSDIPGQIEKCAKDATNEAEKEVISHGGFLESSFAGSIDNGNYLMFNTKKISMLCYTGEDYELCVNEHPVLNKEIENQIYMYIKPKIENCFSNIEKQYRNYDYKQGTLNLSIKLAPKQILIKINKKISYVKSDNTVVYENFNNAINSPLYDFVFLANQIINQEVSCKCGKETCNADLIKLNRDNRDFEITKPVYTGNGEEIYVINEISSEKKFNFAIRNCVRSP